MEENKNLIRETQENITEIREKLEKRINAIAQIPIHISELFARYIMTRAIDERIDIADSAYRTYEQYRNSPVIDQQLHTFCYDLLWGKRRGNLSDPEMEKIYSLLCTINNTPLSKPLITLEEYLDS